MASPVQNTLPLCLIFLHIFLNSEEKIATGEFDFHFFVGHISPEFQLETFHISDAFWRSEQDKRFWRARFSKSFFAKYLNFVISNSYQQKIDNVQAGLLLSW